MMLTLDDYVAVLLQQIWDGRKRKLKEIVYEAHRAGPSQMAKPDKCATQYSTPIVFLGKCLIGSLGNVGEALAVGEGEKLR